MEKILIAKETNRMKVLTKTAKEFSCSPMKLAFALAEGPIIGNAIQKIYWEKDGQNTSGNIFQAECFKN